MSPPTEPHLFRLYISGASPISARAIVNIRRFLERRMPDAHQLQILDIAQHIALARADQIVASPTLVRVTPRPLRRFIGDLSDEARLASGLGLPKELPQA